MEFDLENESLRWTIRKVLDAFYKEALAKVTKRKEEKNTQQSLFIDVDFETSSLEARLQSILSTNRNWFNVTKLKDYPAKTLDACFIDLDIYLSPTRATHSTPTRKSWTNHLNYREHHTIVYGHPGAGKTTLMKRVCHQESVTTDARFMFPVAFRFRELTDYSTDPSKNPDTPDLFQILANFFGLRHSIKRKGVNSAKGDISSTSEILDGLVDYRQQVRETVIYYLDSLNILLILDGFDEIPYAQAKPSMAKDLRILFESLRLSRVVVTSRIGELDYRFEECETFEIAPLNDSQIAEFSEKWLGSASQSQSFIAALETSPFRDVAMRPLNLALLCSVYDSEKELPDRPRVVYQKIFELSLDQWNRQNQIYRTSMYAGFDVYRKIDFLQKLAYELSKDHKQSTFSQSHVREIYHRICTDFDLPSQEVDEVLLEIETHHGVFIMSGFDRYEFVHDSMREFLAARYLINRGDLTDRVPTLVSMPNELAICMALSSDPNYFFYSLVKTLSEFMTNEFARLFLTRLVIEVPNFNRDVSFFVTLCRMYRVVSIDAFNQELLWSSPAANTGYFYTSVAKLMRNASLAKAGKDFLNLYEPFDIKNAHHDTRSGRLLIKMRQLRVLPIQRGARADSEIQISKELYHVIQHGTPFVEPQPDSPAIA